MRKAALVTLPKRFLYVEEVAHVYAVSDDFLRAIPVDELPRHVRGPRTILYDVVDLERYFARFRMGGDETRGKSPRELPTALPVVVSLPPAA